MSIQTTKTYAPFALTTVGTFLLLATILVAIDFVPELRVEAANMPTLEVATSTNPQPNAEPPSRDLDATPAAIVPRDNTPVRITIPSISLDTAIVTPISTDTDVLDRALLTGAVRYPDSAHAGERGTMLLFGHSSYLPVVHNKAFQAFNELDDVEPGDQVTVYSTTHQYYYEVIEVRLTRADEEVVVFEASEPLLTLATCNTFGARQERWVAQARLTNVELLEPYSATTTTPH